MAFIMAVILFSELLCITTSGGRHLLAYDSETQLPLRIDEKSVTASNHRALHTLGNMKERSYDKRDGYAIYGHRLLGDQIRLLDLRTTMQSSTLAEQDYGSICCSLDHAPLQQDDFIAISYCWGNDSRPISIRVNNSRFQTTPNAHNNLKMLAQASIASLGSEFWHLRRFSVRKVWIDQSWINQHDNDENGAPQRHMGDSYMSAGTNFIWLGNPAGKRDKREIGAFK